MRVQNTANTDMRRKQPHLRNVVQKFLYFISVTMWIHVECLPPDIQNVLYYIVTCGLSGSTIFFSTLSHKGHDFRGKKLLNIKRVFWFTLQLLLETFPILRWIRWDIKKKCTGLHVQYRYSCQILIKREFSDIFSKNTEIWTFMKIRPVKA